MGKHKIIFFSILTIAIITITLILTATNNVYFGAQKVYRIYLNGESIGLIKNKKELEEYIDKEQLDLKKTYDVKKVYAPYGLEVKEEITYNTKIDTTENIYEKIKQEESFTIDGYKVTIKSNGQTTSESDDAIEPKEEIVYIMKKEDLETAINQIVLSFVSEKEYNAYLNNEQEEIKETGEIIKNVYIEEQITIKKDHIPTNETILTNAQDLAKYLLFGSNKQTKYKVKDGDSIESIAEKNHLNVNELIIANPTLAKKNPLISKGQELVVSLIEPKITIIEESQNASYKDVSYKTETRVDPNLFVGETRVIRAGKKGVSLVTTNIQTANGQIRTAYNISSIEVSAPVSRIVAVGEKTAFVVGGKEWAWPTKSGYTLTDSYGWRWGKLHAAQDIAGLGCNSPIYAAQSGTVTVATFNSSLGNYVKINHNNGYVTLYDHLSQIRVSKGQGVSKGQVIGLMGETGFAMGCHLHFGVEYHGRTINPMLIYR